MQNNIYNPAKLVEHIRDGLVEQEHSGFIVLKKGSDFVEVGETLDYPFYLRSCAKPLQASLMIDYNLDEKYNLTSEEIAICCASHAGETCHQEVAKRLLNKVGIEEKLVKCGLHKPFAKAVLNEEPTIFHNNCVGKHILMLALCKELGFDFETYFEKTHPLQLMIKEKIYELCQYNGNSPVTKDGCGVPIVSMPLVNMLVGFINLFSDEKYENLKNAFLENPYIIGGEDRHDTKIMQNCPGIVAKVGAEGLCIVVNTKTNDGFIVKILDSDMKTREFVLLNVLNQLGWEKFEIDDSIKTLHDEVIGKKTSLFSL